jgi:hypothetical protein
VSFCKILPRNLSRYCIYSPYCYYTCDLNILGTRIKASVLSSQNRGVTNRVSHLEIAHDVWLKLYNSYEGSSEIESSRKDTYNMQYQTFSQKPGESLDDCFARFESIVSNLRACGPLAYTENECAKHLLYALDDHVWGMKIIALEESANFATLDIEK